MNIGEWIRKWSQLSPQKIAIIDDGHEISYKELNQRSNQVANFLLKKGIHKGIGLESFYIIAMNI